MRKKVLVVDDDHDIIEIVTVVLESAGYEVITSYTSKLISEIDKINPDLILLDHWIPNDSGTDFCVLLKSNPVTALIPVILFFAQHTIAENAKLCGADAYLAKPFDVDALEAIVGEMTLTGSGKMQPE